MKTLLIIFFILFTFSVFAQEEVGARSSNLARLKTNLEAVVDRKPYKADEHSAIKAYFAEVASFIEDLEEYPKYLRKFNQYLRNEGVESYCKNAFVDQKRWNDLVKNCSKNSFFLCSESVREYPGMKQKMVTLLDDDNKSEMGKNPSCK